MWLNTTKSSDSYAGMVESRRSRSWNNVMIERNEQSTGYVHPCCCQGHIFFQRQMGYLGYYCVLRYYTGCCYYKYSTALRNLAPCQTHSLHTSCLATRDTTRRWKTRTVGPLRKDFRIRWSNGMISRNYFGLHEVFHWGTKILTSCWFYTRNG